MEKINVTVAGGSGYTGGELLRLLLYHPYVQVGQVTSETFIGKFLHKAHPNLRKLSSKKFESLDTLQKCDLLFVCLPHGESMRNMQRFNQIAQKIIDLSADFRLNDIALYKKWYKQEHLLPEYLNKFVYGIPELHRSEMQNTNWVSSAGCNATATILGLYPIFKNNLAEVDKTVVEVKVGSSEGGNKASSASHHPERSGCVRSFKPTQHRHIAEMIQELSFGNKIKIHFSGTSIDMVRGVLATCHVFLRERLEEKDIWKLYRDAYSNEPFIRIIKEKDSIYRYPEPKLLIGSNYCDIGFELDQNTNRVVIMSAIDNLMKGAAGQAVQALNLMYGFDEITGLEFPGLHPI
jgi:N-acetyl-gamma-glutamyl-phosphate/LysW-gamma-L-alpha-aminoadipyl-6-phosphate reductase